jgi:hypothetical protein
MSLFVSEKKLLYKVYETNVEIRSGNCEEIVGIEELPEWQLAADGTLFLGNGSPLQV